MYYYAEYMYISEFFDVISESGIGRYEKATYRCESLRKFGSPFSMRLR